MPERVYSETYTRDLGWDINAIGEAAGWDTVENDVIKTLCRAQGVRGNVRFRDYRDHGTFANMLSDLGDDSAGAERHTVLIPDEVVIAADTTVPGNLTLVRIADGKFVIAGGVYLYWNVGSRLVTEDNIQVFDLGGGSCGVGNTYASNAIPYFTPEMFGGGGANGIYAATRGVRDSVVVPTGRYSPFHIINDVTITGYEYLIDTIDIAYIRPGVTITVEAGGELTIERMTARYDHEAFVNNGGVLILRSPGCREQFISFAVDPIISLDETPVTNRTLFYFDASGNPKFRRADGQVCSITFTED